MERFGIAIECLLYKLHKRFSPSYRFERMLETGEDIWRRLGHNLPLPTGDKKEDELRIKGFIHGYFSLSKTKEQNALKLWLKHQLEECEELCNTPTEKNDFHRKWLNIYQQHLDAISG